MSAASSSDPSLEAKPFASEVEDGAADRPRVTSVGREIESGTGASRPSRLGLAEAAQSSSLENWQRLSAGHEQISRHDHRTGQALLEIETVPWMRQAVEDFKRAVLAMPPLPPSLPPGLASASGLRGARGARSAQSPMDSRSSSSSDLHLDYGHAIAIQPQEHQYRSPSECSMIGMSAVLLTNSLRNGNGEQHTNGDDASDVAAATKRRNAEYLSNLDMCYDPQKAAATCGSPFARRPSRLGLHVNTQMSEPGPNEAKAAAKRPIPVLRRTISSFEYDAGRPPSSCLRGLIKRAARDAAKKNKDTASINIENDGVLGDDNEPMVRSASGYLDATENSDSHEYNGRNDANDQDSDSSGMDSPPIFRFLRVSQAQSRVGGRHAHKRHFSRLRGFASATCLHISIFEYELEQQLLQEIQTLTQGKKKAPAALYRTDTSACLIAPPEYSITPTAESDIKMPQE